MIEIEEGTRAYKIIRLLSLVGEYPVHSIDLISGNGGSIERAIRTMQQKQNIRYRDSDGNEHIISSRLISVSGEGEEKTIRLYKKALDALDGISPYAKESYMQLTSGHTFRGGVKNIWRAHRVAESICMMDRSGVVTADYIKPHISVDDKQPQPIGAKNPVFYTSKELKQSEGEVVKAQCKVVFTSVAGYLTAPSGVFAVYNTNKGMVTWNARGEEKVQALLHTLSLKYAPHRYDGNGVKRVVILGRGYVPATRIYGERESIHKLERINMQIPQEHMHYVPMDENGIRLLRLLCVHDYLKRVSAALFSPEMLNKMLTVDCDAYDPKQRLFYLLHLDGDIKRLQRFADHAEAQKKEGKDSRFAVVCFPFQEAFVRECMGDAHITRISLDKVEAIIGL